MNELQTVYMDTLEKMLSVENTIIGNLPGMIGNATSEKLAAALSDHLEETRGHKDRLERIFAAWEYDLTGIDDKPFAMMVEEAGDALEELTDAAVRDAMIIASAQAIEHHEIAWYGTLAAWATRLDKTEDCDLLEQTLKEEKDADAKLSAVAEGGFITEGVNDVAAA